MDAILTVIVALADGSVESGSPCQVPDGQEGDRGLHAHAGPQQELQGLGRLSYDHQLPANGVDVKGTVEDNPAEVLLRESHLHDEPKGGQDVQALSH